LLRIGTQLTRDNGVLHIYVAELKTAAKGLDLALKWRFKIIEL